MAKCRYCKSELSSPTSPGRPWYCPRGCEQKPAGHQAPGEVELRAIGASAAAPASAMAAASVSVSASASASAMPALGQMAAASAMPPSLPIVASRADLIKDSLQPYLVDDAIALVNQYDLKPATPCRSCGLIAEKPPLCSFCIEWLSKGKHPQIDLYIDRIFPTREGFKRYDKQFTMAAFSDTKIIIVNGLQISILNIITGDVIPVAQLSDNNKIHQFRFIIKLPNNMVAVLSGFYDMLKNFGPDILSIFEINPNSSWTLRQEFQFINKFRYAWVWNQHRLFFTYSGRDYSSVVKIIDLTSFTGTFSSQDINLPKYGIKDGLVLPDGQIAFLVESSFVVTEIIICNVDHWQAIAKLQFKHHITSRIVTFKILSSGLLAIGFENGLIKLYNIKTWRQVACTPGIYKKTQKQANPLDSSVPYRDYFYLRNIIPCPDGKFVAWYFIGENKDALYVLWDEELNPTCIFNAAISFCEVQFHPGGYLMGLTNPGKVHRLSLLPGLSAAASSKRIRDWHIADDKNYESFDNKRREMRQYNNSNCTVCLDSVDISKELFTKKRRHCQLCGYTICDNGKCCVYLSFFTWICKKCNEKIAWAIDLETIHGRQAKK